MIGDSYSFLVVVVLIMNQKKFTKDHEWVLPEGDSLQVGITDFAQHELGELVFVDLVAEVGTSVSKGDVFAVVESTKAASDVYSPVSGRVVAVNEAVADSPALINEAADTTWIMKIEASNISELEELLEKEEYEQLCN